MEAVQEAIHRYGKPAIFNTDQGCQFTSLEFTGLLVDNGIQISMDGKGCWRDNVFVERFWRSVKYEEVYLHAYDGVSEAKKGVGRYVMLYNQRRPHTALGGRCSLEPMGVRMVQSVHSIINPRELVMVPLSCYFFVVEGLGVITAPVYVRLENTFNFRYYPEYVST